MGLSLFDLKGKTALITGSGRGIGYMIAKGLGECGAAIILNDMDTERLNNAADTLKSNGLEVYTCPFDVTDKKHIEVGIKCLKEKIGSIDILINNAGIQRRMPLEDFTAEEWQKVIDTNLSGAFYTAQTVAKDMIMRKSGKIINICSLASELCRPTTGPYSAAKGGLKMLTKAMAAEWAKYNIQINGIGPGYILTEMTQPLAENPDFTRWLRSRTPADRWGVPEELVGTAIFLASEASNFVNGQIIYVDGGFLSMM
jgi:gluconate 5-dehydrogenase